ncbi:putative DNA-binding transcriptional regulator [Serratia fonticola]|uniref:helix-turn-helix domain-containing protein n=1 Tax=Serratia fonticola TaxID=47917 RepID=UPI000464EC6B|nr:helix-turn-helix domain-containing protein [Serratia fonticola]CAI1969616.1 putative DNA-binding transcriptional regulator [Serratia fonticola]
MYDFSKVTERTKALAAVDEILASIRSIAQIKQGRTGQRFYLEQNDKRMCFLLYSGICIAKRTQDSLVLSTIRAPCIIGLQDVFHAKSDVQLLAISDVEYGILPVDDFFRYADTNDVWKDICLMLMLSTTRFSEYQRETVGISNYELICNLLNSLSIEDFEIRATTTALEYIQERSLLSRSGIMKTLSSLKTGGYIDIKNGLLIKINSLPKKF